MVEVFNEMVRLQAMLPVKIYRKMKVMLRTRGLSVSKYIRELILMDIERWSTENKLKK